MIRVVAVISCWIGAMCSFSAAPFARGACLAPQAVCDTRDTVFQIKSFDPYGSAVRIADDMLVTNRHIVADEKTVVVFTDEGQVTGTVVPTSFRGDLVMVKAPLPDGPVATLRETPLTTADRLRTVGYDLGQKSVRVYIDGAVLATPVANYPLARLHHAAHTQPGNSGGAVVDENGQLVGIATSGGAGIFEAIPAAAVNRLRAKSGPDHAKMSASIGLAYRNCTLATEAARRIRAKMPIRIGTVLEGECLETRNRQLIALAAQSFGRTRDFDTSERLFNTALAVDPNAINTRLGLAVTLMFARKPKVALPHVRELLAKLPDNLTVHRMAIQAGKLTDDESLIGAALDAIRTHNPKGLAAAERFLKQPPRRPRTQQ